MAHRVVALVVAVIACFGCGEGTEAGTGSSASSPHRSAAQDQALRAMVRDVLEGQACEALVGRFLPLPEDRISRPASELPISVGRLWVDECEVRADDDAVAIELAGRGWQWVDRAGEGPLGSSFRLRGNIRMRVDLDIMLEPDLAYDEDAHRLVVHLTPSTSPTARVSALGELPVVAEGGWSGIIGGFGGLLGGGSPDELASSQFESAGASTVRRQLADGMTFTVELCHGQPDVMLGALGDGDAPPERPFDDGRFHYDNARSLLVSDGLEISGPFPMRDGLRAEVEIESGEPLSAALVCEDQARASAEAYLTSRTVSVQHTLASGTVSRSEGSTLSARVEGCDQAYLMVWPRAPGSSRTVYRTRVRPYDDEAHGLAPCGD